MFEVKGVTDGWNALLKLCLEWEEEVLVDLEEPTSLMYYDLPSGLVHT